MRSPFLAAILAALLPLAAHAAAIEKLDAFLATTKTVRAGFEQTVHAASGRKPQQSSGVMMLSRPGKFRWQIDKPYQQLMVGDGERFWIYDPDLKQVTVRRIGKALGSTPAALLAGNGIAAVEKAFVLKEAGEREGLEWLEATPKSQDSGFDRVRIGFRGADLAAMELQDSFGQTTALHFSRLEKNPALPANLFQFTPPAGADVVGE